MSNERMLRKPAVVSAIAAMAAATALLIPAASSASGANSLPTLKLSLTKSTVTVSGSMTSGAVNVVTTVKGEPADSPTLVLIKPGITVAAFAKELGSLGESTPLDAIDPYGTIVFSGFASAGSPSTAEAVLAPGTYVALENGHGHAVFTVAQSAAPAALPKPAATIRAIDFRFRGPTTLHDGELVRFKNDGYLVHMFLWASGKSAADARKAEADLLAGTPNQAKKYATGLGQFAGPLSSGMRQQEIITEPPGVYVIFCAMNSQDGRDHYQLGMYRTIRIVK